mmetsp:Transcript_10125/g.26218  ORF Transcript_10125/g.26218 Transcript_10125/m.26218 type:complete len:102 (+) Transcript_10125:398-703(+)
MRAQPAPHADAACGRAVWEQSWRRSAGRKPHEMSWASLPTAGEWFSKLDKPLSASVQAKLDKPLIASAHGPGARHPPPLPPRCSATNVRQPEGSEFETLSE